MGLGCKAPAPADFAARADALIAAYRDWLRRDRGRACRSAEKLRRGLAQLYRSKGERTRSPTTTRPSSRRHAAPLARAG